MNEFEQLQEKVLSLTAVIAEKHPRLPTLLKEILVALKAQPENVLLLQPEEISEIVRGIETQQGVYLAASVTKPAAQKSTISKIKLNPKLALDLD